MLQTGVEYTNYQMNRQQFSQYDINEIWQDAFLYKASQEINKLMGYVNINNSLPKGWSLSYGGKYIYTQNTVMKSLLIQERFIMIYLKIL